MDCGKVGDLLYRLRREKNLTQKQVADQLNISDKTVSKWERGLGCPDVSLLGELSGLFGVNIEKILADNDSYAALSAADSLVVTGPTGTNVNDLALVLCAG